MMGFLVKTKTEDTVFCEVIDGGDLKSRRHLNVRGKSATLPSITGENSVPCSSRLGGLATDLNDCFLADKDWDDIKFGVEHGVDFYALSFVKSAEVVHELKAFLKGQSPA